MLYQHDNARGNGRLKMSEFDITNVETEVELFQGHGEHSPCDEYEVEVFFKTDYKSKRVHNAIAFVNICHNAVIEVKLEIASHETRDENGKKQVSGKLTNFHWDKVRAAASKAAMKLHLE